MVQKQTFLETVTDEMLDATRGVAVGAMAVATMFTAVEAHHFAGHTTSHDQSHAHSAETAKAAEDPMRGGRGIEETRHESHSGNVVMRSHPTAGTV